MFGVMPDAIHPYIFSTGCVIAAVVVYRLKETYLGNKNNGSFGKIIICILVVLMLPALSILEKNIRPETDPTVFKFPGRIEQIAFNRDGTLAAVGGNKTILWDINTRKHIVLESPGGANGIAFSPDGRYLAVGRGNLWNGATPEDSHIDLWELESKQMIAWTRSIMRNIKNSAAEAVAFSPDSKYLAASNHDGIVEIWDIENNVLAMTLQEGALKKKLTNGRQTDSVSALTYSSDGKSLALGGINDLLSIWDTKTGQLIKVLSTESGHIKGLSYSPNSQLLASAINIHIPQVNNHGSTEKGEVQFWDVQTGKQVKILTWEKASRIQSLAFSPDGKYLVTGEDEPSIRLWDVESGQTIRNDFDHPDSRRMQSVAFSPDGNSVAAASGQYIKIWKVDK